MEKEMKQVQTQMQMQAKDGLAGNGRADIMQGSAFFVSSLRDANLQLQMHLDPSSGRFRRKLVDFITNPENRVMSECDAYHNFVLDLYETGDYDLSLQVCDFALRRAPYNRNILADAIHACAESSQFEKGEEYLKKAMEIPYKLWSFRMFLYGVDFLKAKLSAYPMDEALYERALALAEKYIDSMPYDEHGYDLKAVLLVMMNEREKAVAELQDFIFHIRPDEMDAKSELIAAQCCITLLKLLDDSHDYDLIIRVCDRGLRNTTQAQPTASIGYFVYRKALALDAKAHDEQFRVPDTIAQALGMYQAAYDLNQDRVYERTIERRYAVLRPYAKDFQPLVRRKLYVEET